MANVAFDTHKFITGLTKAKMPESQAKILAETYTDLLSDRLATKDDLRNLEERMIERMATKEDIAALELKMKDMTIKLLAGQLASIVAIVALMRYLGL